MSYTKIAQIRRGLNIALSFLSPQLWPEMIKRIALDGYLVWIYQ